MKKSETKRSGKKSRSSYERLKEKFHETDKELYQVKMNLENAKDELEDLQKSTAGLLEMKPTFEKMIKIESLIKTQTGSDIRFAEPLTAIKRLFQERKHLLERNESLEYKIKCKNDRIEQLMAIELCLKETIWGLNR